MFQTRRAVRPAFPRVTRAITAARYVDRRARHTIRCPPPPPSRTERRAAPGPRRPAHRRCRAHGRPPGSCAETHGSALRRPAGSRARRRTTPRAPGSAGRASSTWPSCPSTRMGTRRSARSSRAALMSPRASSAFRHRQWRSHPAGGACVPAAGACRARPGSVAATTSVWNRAARCRPRSRRDPPFLADVSSSGATVVSPSERTSAPPSARVERIRTKVNGGGQAGRAICHHLAERDIDFVVLDAEHRSGDVWRRRWDSLRHFTPAAFSGLPAMVRSRLA